MNGWLKSEDRRRIPPTISPTKFLESIGIDNYQIDWEENTVYLPGSEFARVASELDVNLKDSTQAFTRYGWTWRRAQG